MISAVLFFQISLAKCKARNFFGRPVASANWLGNIEKMIEIIPADHHKFRTVHPEKTEKQMKETEKERWDMEI